MKTEKKRLFFNIFFGYLLLSLICAGIVFGSKTYAATPSCDTNTICAVVKLSGTIPSKITLKATATNSNYLQSVKDDGWYKTYTLSKISNDTYFLKSIDPYNTDHYYGGLCSTAVEYGPNPNPEFTFSFSVTGGSSPVSKSQDLACGTNSISINLGSTSPSGGTTTPPTSKASLTGRIIVKTASDEVYACTPSIYTNALTGSYGPNFHLITLNPGNFTLDAIDSGSISFPNVNSGPTTMKGQVDPCNATDQSVNIPRFSVNFNLNAGSNIKFFIIDTTNNNHVTISATDPLAFNNEPATCESTGGALAWITCKLVDGLAKGEAALESAVISMLVSPSLDLQNGTSNCNAKAEQDATNNTNNITGQEVANSCIFQTWSNFRIYGDIFLVIALLVAVIVEAMGGGLISNYTIKKMLPRIIVAVILINLSIYIVAILEDIFNVLGAGIYDLIHAPFASNPNFTFKLNSSGTGDFLGLFGGLGLAAGGAVFGSLWLALSPGKGASILAGLGDAAAFLLIFVVLPIFIAVFSALITLMFRQAILVFLLLVSPIAFALYCLPNTEQYFKKWWDLLIKTLAVYPIVVTIFCMTQVMAIIFGAGDIGDPFLSKLLAIIAVGAPIFLVPFAFRISGGAIKSVEGAVKNGGNKLSSMVKGNPGDPNSRGNRVKSRFENRREEAGLSVGAMTTGLRGMVGGRGGLIRRARSGAVAVGSRQAGIALSYGASTLNKNPIYNMYKRNDDFLTALINPELAKQKRDLTVVGSAERASWDSMIAAAGQVPQSRATVAVTTQQFAENGSGFGPGQEAHDLLMENAAKAAGAQVEYGLGNDGKQHATGFSGPNAGAANNLMNGHKAALINSRADLANIGSTRYDPLSKYGQLSFEDMATQRKEVFTNVNDRVKQFAVSHDKNDLALVARHLEELRTLSQTGGVSPEIAMEARKGIMEIQKTLYTNPEWAAFSGQTGEFGGVADVVNVDTYGRGHIDGSVSKSGPSKNGQYMSNHEMELIIEHQDQIRNENPSADPLYRQAIAQARKPYRKLK